MNRREFILGAAAAACTAKAVAADAAANMANAAKAATPTTPTYHVFSRVFQFLKDPFRAADLIKSCGYDGVEWTVRPGGFCEPGNAAAGFRVLDRKSSCRERV